MLRVASLMVVAALAVTVMANPARVRFGNDVYIAHNQMDPTSTYAACELSFKPTIVGLNNQTAEPAGDDFDVQAVLAALPWGGNRAVVNGGASLYATGPFLYSASDLAGGSGDGMTQAPDGRVAVTSCATFVLMKLTDEPVMAGETIVRAHGEEIVNFVTFDGADFATIDDAPVDDTGYGGLSGPRRYVVPYGWIMAPPEADTQIARIGHPFGSVCALTSDGTGYDRYGSVCAQPGDGALVNSTVYDYTVSSPLVRSGFNILITRPSNRADSWIARPAAFTNVYDGGSLTYATLDDGDPTADYTDLECDLRARRLPPGWSLASDAPTVFTSAATQEWGTQCLLGDTSNAYPSWVVGRGLGTTGNCSAAVELTVVPRGAETYYAVSACPARVLISKQSSFTIGLKTLIIATVPNHDRDPRLGVAENYLQGIGAPYDIHYVIDEATDLVKTEDVFPESLLFDAEGNPKYYVVLKTHARMFYDPPGSVISPYDALSSVQDQQLNAYAAAFSVRIVNLYSQALYVTGLEAAGPPSLDDMGLIFDSSVTQEEAPGINLNNRFDTTSIFHFPARYDGSGAANIRPVIRFRKYSANLVQEFGGEFDNTFAGVIVNEAGAETMHLFYDSSKFFTFSNLFANYWFNWSSRGMYIGERRIYLSGHVDDMFLYTLAFNDTSQTNGVDEDDEVRVTENDLELLIQWQDNLNARLPAGSNFTLEMAYNMDGINQYQIFNPTALSDPLLDALTENGGARRDKFFWESHTYSHKSMTCLDSSCRETEFACVNATNSGLPRDARCAQYPDIVTELKDNFFYAQTQLYWDPDLGATNYTAMAATHSNNAMVTPLISGLFNGDALQAMAFPPDLPGQHQPIIFAVGDGSRPELNVELPNIADSPYHPMHTTVAVHGSEGVVIVPRWANRIYYNAVDPIDEQVEHDCIYGACYEANTAGNNPNGNPGIFSDRVRQFWEMLEFEATFFLPRLIAFRHDPYMFHQANLIFYTYNGTSFDPPDPSDRWAEDEVTCLVCQWVDRMTEGIMEHYTLPIQTLRHDALGYRFLQREQRDVCGLGGSFQVENGIVNSVNITSTGNCYMAATGFDPSPALGLATETYGPDETLFANRTAGDDALVVPRVTPLDWSTPVACASPTPCFQTINACEDFIGICTVSGGSNSCEYSTIPEAAPCSVGSGVCDETAMCVECTTEQCSDGYFCNGLETCEFGQCRNNTVEDPCDFCHEGFDVCTNPISEPGSVPGNQALPFEYEVMSGTGSGPIEGMSGYGGDFIEAGPNSVLEFRFRVGRDFINGLGTTLRSLSSSGTTWEWLNPLNNAESTLISWYSGSPGTSSFSSSTAESEIWGDAAFTWDESQAVGDAANEFIEWDEYPPFTTPSAEGTVTLRWSTGSGSPNRVDYMGISFIKCGNGFVDVSFGGLEEECDALLPGADCGDTYCGT